MYVWLMLMRNSFVAGVMLCALASVCGGVEVPQSVELSEVVRGLLDDDALTDMDRRRLSIFHGQWKQVTDPDAFEAAQIAWLRGDIRAEVFQDVQVPVLLRARAALARGEAEQALELVKVETSAQAGLIQARSLSLLGRRNESEAFLIGWRQRLAGRRIDDAAELMAAGEMVAELARLQGRPGQDYGLAMSMFGRSRGELDRLYWPAYVAEARLLLDKDNPAEAVDALLQALSLNPSCGEAWYLLGSLTARGFGFEGSERCRKQLLRINPKHRLARLLAVEIALSQKDGRLAVALSEKLLKQEAGWRDAHARLAAGWALRFDRGAVDEALADYQRRWPGDALSHLLTGRHLSRARQYPWGELVLRRAIEIDPVWARPRVELGLLLMQLGDEAAAMVELKKAVRLDEFNRRAHNQLELAIELSGYAQLETEHFIVRYATEVDGVLANDMALVLDEIHRDVTQIFGFRPAKKTVIEILPDKRYLGVRVIGLPDIWTIAACTGDVIAMVAPRIGGGQAGTFHWPTVIRHEFVHTVTLNQTDYRIPHWFTEGCGVWQEPGGYGYGRCRLVAGAVMRGELFGLDKIDLAFARPEKPEDRSLAYAQAGLMVRYIVEKHGTRALGDMMRHFQKGADAIAGIEAVTGEDAQLFMDGFEAWVAVVVEEWGFVAAPQDLDFIKLMGIGVPLDDEGRELLTNLIQEYGEHPDLLRLAARDALEQEDMGAAWGAVRRYGQARPVDDWVDRQLVKLAITQGRVDRVTESIERLDIADQDSGRWAVILARQHRQAGRLDAASAMAHRALEREPFDAGYRELAATIAMQRSDFQGALRHVRGLTLIEPDRARNWMRLGALLQHMGDEQGARSAMERAEELSR